MSISSSILKGLYMMRHKPRFISRFIMNTLRTRILGVHSLRSLCFASTYKCNFDCEHCYAKLFSSNDSNPLTTKEKKQVIFEAYQLGAISVDFIGGEAALGSDFRELVEYASSLHMFVSLTTNGFVTRQGNHLLEFARWGVDNFSVSIDSGIPEEHDTFRRKSGAFESAMRTVERCHELGIFCQILTTVARGTLETEGFRKLLQYCIDTKTTFVLSAVIPFGSYAGRDDILVTNEDCVRMDELNLKHSFIRRDIHSTPEKFGQWGCPAWKQILYVTEFGDVLPCPFLHVSFGNLRGKSMKNIRMEALKNPSFNSYYPVCMPAEDKEFIQKWRSAYENSNCYPPSSKEVFGDDK